MALQAVILWGRCVRHKCSWNVTGGAVRFNVTLYGSLAATGKGHMTDAAILEVLQPVAKTNITWEPKTFLPFHPNGMLFESYNESGEELDTWTVYSIGGGNLGERVFQ